MSYSFRIFVVCISVVFILVSLSCLNNQADAASEEVMSQNAYLSLLPLVELYTESNPDDENVREDHYKRFEAFATAIEKNKVTFPLALFTDSTKTDISKFKEIPEQVNGLSSKPKYKEAIRNYYEEVKQSLKYNCPPNRQNNVDHGIRREVLDVLQESHLSTMHYISNFNTSDVSASYDDAQNACMKNRKAISYSFLFSATHIDFFGSEEPLIQFKNNIEMAIFYNKALLESLPDTEEFAEKRSHLKKYTYSEFRRLKILEALIEDDIQLAQALLLAALDEALLESNS